MATTVAAGSSATFEVGPYDTITLTDANAVGTLALTSQTPKIASDQTLAVQNGTFGPWRAPMSVVMTVTQGSADYTVNTKSLTVSQATATTAMVSGAGTGYRTVLFGDSMVDTYETVVSGVTAAYNATTGDLTVTYSGHQQAVGWWLTIWNRNFSYPTVNGIFRRQVTSVPDSSTFVVNVGAGRNFAASDANWRYRPESWRSAQAFVPWLQMVSNQRFNVVYNGGASGDRADEALARLQVDCLDYSPHLVICQMPGVNDTGAGNTFRSLESIVADRHAIVDRILASGARLVLLTTTPYDLGWLKQKLVDRAIAGAGQQSRDAALAVAAELIQRGQGGLNDVNRSVHDSEKQAHESFQRAAGQHAHDMGIAAHDARGQLAAGDRYSAMAGQAPAHDWTGAGQAARLGQMRDALGPQQFAPGVETKSDYQKAVADYLKATQEGADPYRQAAVNDTELGRTISDAPLSDYMQTIATQQFGLDPNIARGLYGPEKVDVADYKAGRDLTSLQQTGMLPGEYQDMLDQQTADAQDQQDASDAEVEAQIGQAITEQTGYDADALSQSTDLDLGTLGNVISSEVYRQYDGAIRQAASAGDQAELERTMAAAARGDQTVYRVLEHVWAPQLGGSYTPAAPNTWQSTKDPYKEALASLTQGG